MGGLEEILGNLLEKIGIDLLHMSKVRAILVALLYYSIGLILFVGGIYYFLNHPDDAVGKFCSLIVAAIGVAYLVRISVNLVVYLRTP